MANLTKASGNRHEDWISGISKRVEMAGGTALTYYQGGFIGRKSDGYCVKMDDTANMRFVGLFQQGVRGSILSTDSSGDVKFDVLQPRFIEATISDSVSRTNIGWPVYAKYDDEVSILNGTYGNFMGFIREIVSSTVVLIEPWYDMIPPRWLGSRTMAATGNQSLTIGDLGKTIIVPNTATLEIALPALSTVPTGQGYRLIKVGTTATAITINPDASETINGASTNAAIATNYESSEIVKVETGSGTFEWVMPTFA